jgi:hypothetical protein
MVEVFGGIAIRGVVEWSEAFKNCRVLGVIGMTTLADLKSKLFHGRHCSGRPLDYSKLSGLKYRLFMGGIVPAHRSTSEN